MDGRATLVTLGRAARTEANLKVRQPLRRALVVVPEGPSLSAAVLDEVADELNVKQVEAVSDLEGLLDYTVVPNFRSLGPKVGKLMPAVKAALQSTDGCGRAAGARRRRFVHAHAAVRRFRRALRRRRRGAGGRAPRARARAGRRRTRSRSTPRSTTTCASRVSPVSSCAR